MKLGTIKSIPKEIGLFLNERLEIKETPILSHFTESKITKIDVLNEFPIHNSKSGMRYQNVTWKCGGAHSKVNRYTKSKLYFHNEMHFLYLDLCT